MVGVETFLTSKMIQVTVLFFASLKQQAGVPRGEISIPDGACISDLKKTLSTLYPGLEKGLSTSLVSINHEFAFDQDHIPSGAEIGIFPPVSGGDDYPTIVSITADTLDLDDLVERITLDTSGAVCLFTGIVRGKTFRNDPHETTRLEYEAYIPMAEQKMRQVAEEIRVKWPAVEGLALVQRIGVLDPKTPTVLIACSSSHRDTGVFEAARYGIDRLKEIVPIWKKEIGPDGDVWVEGKYHPSREDNPR